LRKRLCLSFFCMAELRGRRPSQGGLPVIPMIDAVLQHCRCSELGKFSRVFLSCCVCYTHE
jgi:hypothetical protein